MNSIKVLCLEDCSSETLNKYREDIRQLKDSEFEPLVVSNKDGEQSKIMVKIKDNMIREMVICHVDDEVAVVHLKGKIKPEDVAQVVNKHDDDR